MARPIGFEPLGVVLGRGPVVVPVIKPKASRAQLGAALTDLGVRTTAGALGDVTGALNALPGTTRVGTAGQLLVRGGVATRPGHFWHGTVVVPRAIASRWALDGTEPVPGVNNAGVPTGGGIAIAFARPVGLSTRSVQIFHEAILRDCKPNAFRLYCPSRSPRVGAAFFRDPGEKPTPKFCWFVRPKRRFRNNRFGALGRAATFELSMHL